mgnify:CR=1 FL=1|tara:strand:- start:116 stop:430 length:315 start_codon:yes stop_codon:yes gene_type:complete
MENKKVNSEELYRMWGESKVNVTQEFTDTIEYLIEKIADKYYNGVPGIEKFKVQTLPKVIEIRNKYQGYNNGEHAYGYFHVVIKSYLIGMIHKQMKDNNQIKIR